MNIFDVLIIIAILSAGYTGSRNGLIKQGVVLLGTIISFVLSWFLKDSIANFLSFNLPFFDFNGLSSLNIVMYQLIAFLCLLTLFFTVLIVIVRVSGVIEKILKMTLILNLPSKIGGFIIGLIEGYVIVFVILFFLNQPIFNFNISNSKLANPIVNSSPGLSNVVSKMNDSINDIYIITKDYTNNSNANKTNRAIVNTLLEHNVIDDGYVAKLREKQKINY